MVLPLSYIAILYSLAIAVIAGDAPSAVVKAGTVVGVTTTLPSSTAVVNKFLGIPYAQPPTNERRFLPPQPLASFTQNPVNATAWGSKCFMTQYNSRTFFQNRPANCAPHSLTIVYISSEDDGIPESEDCLYLNVYAPAAVGCSLSGRPVLLWIHGGWLRSGTASQHMFDGSSFASEHGIVVVTFNYRLNVFGFPNSPQLPLDAQNLGFLDQRLVLAWVQANIHAFGGDPSKVTIAGESSGASSVDRLVTTLHTSAPFRAAACSSGQATVSAIGRDSGPQSWAALAFLLGCSGQDEIACVRGIDAETVRAMANNLDFSPVNDNITQKELPYLPTRAAGGLARVPLLIGSTGQEGTYLAPAYGLDISSFTEPALIQVLGLFTGDNPELTNGILQVIQLIQQTTGLSLFHAAAQVYTDIVYQCVTRTNIPTWRYFYNASFPNLAAEGYTSEELLSSHGSDTVMIWGTYPKEGATDRQIRLSRYLQSVWAGFVKNPSGTGPGWREVDVDGHNIACIGCGGDDEAVPIASPTIDGRCPLYAPYFDQVKTPFVRV
ncbi:Carboxylesterase 5A [Colletotrichum chlorophyti]|uniref:Carboxylic ester hydrolase n=1 Tax=Colletotrichum chlorophyti TaxID=708187 RepID=A0A1Q8RA59_9PEZI|nr:Carboxylesterase 5A [Colletotrichum chlorophyti]